MSKIMKQLIAEANHPTDFIKMNIESLHHILRRLEACKKPTEVLFAKPALEGSISLLENKLFFETDELIQLYIQTEIVKAKTAFTRAISRSLKYTEALMLDIAGLSK